MHLEKAFSFGGDLGAIFGDSNFNEDADTDAFWMHQALVESMKSIGRCNPNPAVGCIIVNNGREIARGHTQAYGGKHAERTAIESLKDQSLLDGATAYVTLEPCAHHGRQPPCSSLLAGLPLKRVVIARVDSDPRVSGRGVGELIRSGKMVKSGVLEKEVTALNFPFFRTRKSNLPFVALKWAQTLDGQLADDGGRSQWISGAEARVYTHWLRQKYDAVMVGVGTYLADQSRLTVRDCYPISRQPIKIIFDPNATLAESKISASEEQYFVFVKNKEVHLPEGFIAVQVDGEGVREQILSGLASSLIFEAHGRPLQSLLVEGGAKLLTSLVDTELYDVAHVFVAPTLTGGSKNRVGAARQLANPHLFENICTQRLGRDILLEFVKLEPWVESLRGPTA